MANDKALRQHLLKLLEGKGAHVDFETAVKKASVAVRGKRPKGAAHSPWEILEHMRIAQWDILEFSRDAEARVARVAHRLLAQVPRPAHKDRLEPSRTRLPSRSRRHVRASRR